MAESKIGVPKESLRRPLFLNKRQAAVVVLQKVAMSWGRGLQIITPAILKDSYHWLTNNHRLGIDETKDESVQYKLSTF